MRSVNGRFWLFDIIYLRRVVGDSMLPTLRQNNIVLGISKKTYKRGDIVIAKIGKKEVVKRVNKIVNNNYELRGDNQYASTDSRHFGLLNKNMIIAKVIIKI